MLDPAAHLSGRRTRYDAVSGRLGSLDDAALSERFEAAAARASFGGRSGVIEVEGAKVWAKGIALTDLERRPANWRRTANYFRLPIYYQYGVGSAGFGAWRELAANVRATNWALAGECVSFPLLYHWRVLPAPRRPPPDADELARAERYIAGWNGAPAVRRRWQANYEATANLVLFFEHVPHTVHAWVTEQAGKGTDEAEAALAKLDDELSSVARFINARGMLHFDLHAANVLTDGRQFYVADFGLAICDDFELSPAERGFFDRHRGYDRAFIAVALVHFFDALKPAATASLTARVEPQRRLAGLQAEFLRRVRANKLSRYPAKRIERALAELGD